MAETRAGHYQWFRTAAVHIWRTYFKYQADHRAPDTPAKVNSFRLCNAVRSGWADYEERFLPLYYTSPWNGDEAFVEQYSRQTGISTLTLWRSVFDSNRRLFEMAELLDPKD